MNKINFLLIFVLAACTTTPEPADQPSAIVEGLSDSDYYKLIKEHSAKDEKYSGLYSIYQFHSTILNSQVTEAQLELKAKDFKWPRETYLSEKQRATESLARESKIFVSFYSPVNENDNLDSNKTIWKLWLVVDGVHYEGVASKSPGILAQHQRLYPYHTRFFTPYVVTFKVPMMAVQTNSSKLILTGPIGTSEVNFAAMR